MKKVLLASVATLATVTAFSAFAADLPSRKAAPDYAPPPPMWTGFYAGLNAGYNFGTNKNVGAVQWGPYGPAFNGSGTGIGSVAPALNALSNAILGPGLGAPGLAMSGNMSNTQSGFIGGGQVGYNYQYGSNIVLGVEADIQGTGIRGSSYGAGAGGYGRDLSAFVGLPANSVGYSEVATGSNAVQGGVDWMGTVRGRIGYLWTPTLLVYGTGGFAYGNVYANVVSTAQDSNTIGAPGFFNVAATASRTFVGGGRGNQINTGWTAGGGVEWMFMPNWSLKAEALYWDLGNMNVATSSFAGNVASLGYTAGGAPTALGWGAGNTYGTTRVNYQGVTARAGVNYHFNWGAAPVVAAY